MCDDDVPKRMMGLIVSPPPSSLPTATGSVGGINRKGGIKDEERVYEGEGERRTKRAGSA